MKRYTFLLALCLLAPALPAGAAEVPTVDDTRLEQKISVTEEGDRLAAVLERLSKTAGVTLAAERPLCNVTVVVRYEGALRGFMHALAGFFDIDKEYDCAWRGMGSVQNHRYLLERPAFSSAEMQRLRAERQSTLERQMDQAIRDGNRWVKHFGTLTDAQRLAVYRGIPVTLHADQMGGEPYLAEVLGDNRSQWGDDVSITFQMIGRSPFSQSFQWTLREGGPEGESGGQQLTEGVRVAQICPGLTPERQQMEWRERYGDPVPAGGPKVALYGQDAPPEAPLRREVLLRIASRARVNLIADDCGQVLRLRAFPADTLVSELLDAACAPTFGPQANNPGSFWRKVADTYLVRSLAWPEEEP